MKAKGLFAVLFLLLVSAGAQAQCAMCKAAAESDLQNNPNSIAHGLNTGILFLMFIPYLIMGVIFRKDVLIFVKNITNKEKTPFNRNRLKKFTFLLTFVSCITILFVIFISFYKPY